MTTPKHVNYLRAGAPFVSAFDAAQRALRAWAFAAPLPAKQSVACSHGPGIAAARRDVARQQSVITLEREGSLVALAIETAQRAQPEGPEPGPQDALASECSMQCLYIAERCARPCAGCATVARASSDGRGGEARAEAEARQQAPDGNHGESNSTGGEAP